MCRTTAAPWRAPANTPETSVTAPALQPGLARSPIQAVGIAADTLGWVGVGLLDQRFWRAVHAGTLTGVITRLSGAAVITVGVPLGLPTIRHRTADTTISVLPGHRPLAMLPAPPATALTETTRTAANKHCMHSGYALNRRAWLHRASILEANTVWQHHPRVLFEAYPELTIRPPLRRRADRRLKQLARPRHPQAATHRPRHHRSRRPPGRRHRRRGTGPRRRRHCLHRASHCHPRRRVLARPTRNPARQPGRHLDLNGVGTTHDHRLGPPT